LKEKEYTNDAEGLKILEQLINSESVVEKRQELIILKAG